MPFSAIAQSSISYGLQIQHGESFVVGGLPERNTVPRLGIPGGGGRDIVLVNAQLLHQPPLLEPDVLVEFLQRLILNHFPELGAVEALRLLGFVVTDVQPGLLGRLRQGPVQLVLEDFPGVIPSLLALLQPREVVDGLLVAPAEAFQVEDVAVSADLLQVLGGGWRERAAPLHGLAPSLLVHVDVQKMLASDDALDCLVGRGLWRVPAGLQGGQGGGLHQLEVLLPGGRSGLGAHGLSRTGQQNYDLLPILLFNSCPCWGSPAYYYSLSTAEMKLNTLISYSIYNIVRRRPAELAGNFLPLYKSRLFNGLSLEENLRTEEAARRYKEILPVLLAQQTGLLASWQLVTELSFNPDAEVLRVNTLRCRGLLQQEFRIDNIVPITYADMRTATRSLHPHLPTFLDDSMTYKNKFNQDIYIFEDDGTWVQDTVAHPKLSIGARLDEKEWFDRQNNYV